MLLLTWEPTLQIILLIGGVVQFPTHNTHHTISYYHQSSKFRKKLIGEVEGLIELLSDLPHLLMHSDGFLSNSINPTSIHFTFNLIQTSMVPSHNTNCSTFSNWCTLNIPQVSYIGFIGQYSRYTTFPCLPASFLKQVEIPPYLRKKKMKKDPNPHLKGRLSLFSKVSFWWKAQMGCSEVAIR